ncbi:receptor-type tyrosine-protein phosphatase F-like isoform X2 [Saccostrea cucullata]|uniref:receptor-type tyrosine-protein phosphatase F-like isoform X2 n=1 Tax=Saccostrea cuccullata TaxID=36930 RepID=UPI002ED1E407
MQCQADANGHKFDIEWFKNGVPVDLGDNKRLTITETGSLRIAKALESDYGKYECVATNEYGVTYSYAAMLYIRVRGVPPIFTLPPKRVEVDPNGSVNLTCVAVGSPMPHVMWRDGATELGKPVIGKNVLQLKNVTESKNYTCVASSYLGNIEHIGEVIIKVEPRNIFAEVTGPNTIDVSWDPPSQTKNVVTKYFVYYNDTYLKQESHLVVQGTETKCQLEELTPDTVYTIKVSAISNKGEGAATRIIQAKTLPFVPDEPTNVTAEAINSTAMFVDWQPPEGRDKGATYEFRVKAKNEVGLGERASAVIITPDGGLIAGKGSRSCVISLAT